MFFFFNEFIVHSIPHQNINPCRCRQARYKLQVVRFENPLVQISQVSCHVVTPTLAKVELIQ